MSRTYTYKALLVALLLVVSNLSSVPFAKADVVADDVNATASPSFLVWCTTCTAVGWYYTPSTSYLLTGIQTKFLPIQASDSGDRVVTVEVLTNRRFVGGSLLASATFNSADARGTLGGVTFSSPIPLTGGTTYFIGFRNVQSLGINVTGALSTDSNYHTATVLPPGLYLDNDNVNDGSYETYAGAATTDALAAPILRFFMPTVVDHFLCYKIKAPKFPRGVQVSLADQFATATFDVVKPLDLCTPADKNGEGITDPDTHLKAYQIKLSRTVPPQPKIPPQLNIGIKNQFHPNGELLVNTVAPNRLLVPTAKSLTGPVEPPNPAGHNVDHYECYMVKLPRGKKFSPILGVSVKDQFITKTYNLKRPTRLCTPVDKNSEGIKNSATHLMCYQALPVKGQPKGVPQENVFLNNQFGSEEVHLIKEEELCVPSEKILPD